MEITDNILEDRKLMVKLLRESSNYAMMHRIGPCTLLTMSSFMKDKLTGALDMFSEHCYKVIINEELADSVIFGRMGSNLINTCKNFA